jgi:hypothetical protein
MVNLWQFMGERQMTKDPDAEWQAGYDAGVEACAMALEADAKTSGVLMWSEGKWSSHKHITSARAVEIVRELKATK